jgi:hypothetical protein
VADHPGRWLVLCAVSGLVAGAACDSKPAADKAAPSASGSASNCCVGKNDCKGKGGCGTKDNACAGKNECKGKGGCSHRDCS